jgi:23S rRNA (cytidine1920-2'-O)/16S rRNA (cytidine1409-2'-O)-methyltransferase
MKIRLDDLLIELGVFDSKQKAQTCIMSNGLYIGGKLINKPGKQINHEDFSKKYSNDPSYLKVEEKLSEYVSRGAYKLQSAHQAWGLDFKDKNILDIGASTGGFTDYALKHRARLVLALDVGYGQLHYKLQQDPRVMNLQEINFRYWEMPDYDFKIDMVVCDVSFISIIKILDRLKTILEERPAAFSPDLRLIFLLKPQFEAGKEIMDKNKGVLKDPKIIETTCQHLISEIEKLGFKVLAQIPSPIKGAKGNQEFLLDIVYRITKF